MENGKIEIFQDFLVTQMNYWFLFPVVAAALVFAGSYTGTPPKILGWLPLGLLPFFLYLARRFCRRFFPFALLHGGVMAGGFALPFANMPERVIYVILAAGFIVVSLRLRWNSDTEMDERMHPGFGLGLSAGGLFLMQRLDYPRGTEICATLLILALGLYFLVEYIENYRNFLRVNYGSASHIPEREMFYSGMKLALGYIAGMAAVLALTANIRWLAGILRLLKKGLIALIRLVGKWVVYEPSVGEMAPEGPGQQEGLMWPPMESQEPSLFWNVLEYVALTILLAGFLYFFGRAALRVFRFLYARWGDKARRDGQDPSGVQVPDVKERIQSGGRRRRREAGIRLRLAPDERIRRIYRKQVRRGREVILDMAKAEGRPGDLNLLTAAECGKYLNCSEAAGLYEKARYSDRECSGEDVKKMAKLCRDIV